ncbi:MAG TPA: hypothetical protein VGQ57_03455, partial [Polyangiaceae bacterium]|nr:hypothetical protein [Polyangiaceae bacterium]
MRGLLIPLVFVPFTPTLFIACSGEGSAPRTASSAGGSGQGTMASGAGGDAPAAGTGGSATSAGAGGTMATAGSGGSATSAGMGGGTAPPPGDCVFTVSSQTADQAGPGGIPTVGIVNWSVDLQNLTTANLVFGLPGGTTTTAPVDVKTGPSFRTLVLGMKASKTYAFHLEVGNAAKTCTSPDFMLTTGALPSGTPSITRTAGAAVAAQAKGFIVTSSGVGSFGGGMGGGMMGGGMMGGGDTGGSYAVILDADGDIVWLAPAPSSCSRAKMSVDGQFLW